MIISKTTLSSDVLKDSIFNHHKNALILDIETTGFSAKFAQIYLIGMIYLDPTSDSLICEQWFCENSSDEYELLFRFNKKVLTNNQLYHFNGDLFDLPFIKNRMALYKMTLNPNHSHDLLKRIRPFKKILGLDNIKLKTIEAYLGYDRSDPFNGGELIEVYQRYRESNDQILLKVLLLHNYEDLLGLYEVITHLTFFNLLQQLKDGDYNVSLESMTMDHYQCHVSFPVPPTPICLLTHDLFELELESGLCKMTIPLAVGELKYFFDQPKDYDYLITEDYAVHKSIGKYVDKAHKQPATKETCYIKKEGIFLPSYKHLKLPFNHYYNHYKDVKGFIAIEDILETQHMITYLNGILSLI
jgi:uncharacterized protein YprB with RNaseH-like and TPR domain